MFVVLRTARIMALGVVMACTSPLADEFPGTDGGAHLDGSMSSFDGDVPETPGLLTEKNPSVEAEEYSTLFSSGDTSGNGHWWSIYEDLNAAGGRYIRAEIPGEECQPPSCDIPSMAPRASYELRVREAGTYYVWLRGRPDASGNGSVHLGIDGDVLQTTWALQDAAQEWLWNRSEAFSLGTAGVHTVDLYMSEAAIEIDQVLLTSDEAFVPDDLHNAPPLIWEAEDATSVAGESSQWQTINDPDAFAGKAMQLGPSGFKCYCEWIDEDGLGLENYGECTDCEVETTAAKLVFNKAFENSNFELPDRLWIRARFPEGGATAHVGFVGSDIGGILHGDLPLSSDEPGYHWYAFNLPAQTAGQPVHTSQVELFGGSSGLVVDQVVVTADLDWIPNDSASTRSSCQIIF